MAQRKGSDEIYLFGGRLDNSGNCDNGLWMFSPPDTWLPVIALSTSVPSGRSGHGMFFIDNDNLVIFGGKDSAGVVLSDTWKFNIPARFWTEVSCSSSPSGRYDFALTGLKTGSKGVLFGGTGAGQYYSDTWIFDGTTWENKNCGAAIPAPRSEASITCTPDDTIYLYGGWHGVSNNLKNDLWKFNPETFVWTALLNGPEALRQSGLAYDFKNANLITFGGFNNSGANTNNLFFYQPSVNVWSDLNPSEVPLNNAAARYGHCFIFDDFNQKTLLFGGSNLDLSVFYNDTRYLEVSSSGTYVTPYLDTNYSKTLDWIYFEIEPTGQKFESDLSFQVAASSDNLVWSAWKGPGGSASAHFDGVGPHDLRNIFPSQRFLKYKMWLSTLKLPEFPRVSEIRSYYNRPPEKPVLMSPLNGALTNQTTNQLFRWFPASDEDTDVLKYDINLADNPLFSSTLVISTGIAAEQFLNTAVINSATCYWRVRAFDGIVYSSYSTTFELRIDTIAPSAVTALSGTIDMCLNGQIGLSWISPGDNGANGAIVNGTYVIKYSTFSPFQFSGGTDKVYGPIAYAEPRSMQECLITGLSDATSYYIGLVIYDRAGNASIPEYSTEAVLTNAHPVINVSSSLSGATLSGIAEINWNSSDPNSGDLLTYIIYDSTNSGVSYNTILATDIPNGSTFYVWNTKTVINSAAHRLKIRAADSRGLYSESEMSSDFEIANPNEAPILAISYPVGGETLTGSVNLGYSVTDTNLTDTHSFDISFSSNNGLSFPMVFTATSTIYAIDTALLPNSKQYLIKIRVTDNGIPALYDEKQIFQVFTVINNNLPPNPFSLTFPPTYSSLSQIDIMLAWNAAGDPNPFDTVSYTVFVSSRADFNTAFQIPAGESSSIKLDPELLVNETTYFWKVRARDLMDAETWSSESYGIMVLNRLKSISEDGRVTAQVLNSIPGNSYLSIKICQDTDPALRTAESELLAERNMKAFDFKYYALRICDINGNDVGSTDTLLKVEMKYDNSSSSEYLNNTLVSRNIVYGAVLDPLSSKFIMRQSADLSLNATTRIKSFITNPGIATLLGYRVPTAKISSLTNFPNPFTPPAESTKIRYILSQDMGVDIRAYTLVGDLVWQLHLNAGEDGAKGASIGLTNEVTWNGRAQTGKVLPDGVYILEIRSGDSSMRRKICIQK